MSQSQQVSFYASEEFYQRQGGTLVCGSIQEGRVQEVAQRLGDHSILLLTHQPGEAARLEDKELLDTWSIPSGVPGELLHGQGSHCLALLELSEDLEWDYLWYVHHNVSFLGNWSEFFASFGDSKADFIAPWVRSRQSEPNWYWWESFKTPPGGNMLPEESQFAALSTIFRISRKALEEVRAAIASGWRGHCEAVFPTAVAEAGLVVEDMGSYGSHTPDSRRGLYYSKTTFNAEAVRGHTTGFLHYPVHFPVMPPSPQRFRPATKDIPKILYFSPIGPAAPGLLHDTVARFRQVSAEIRLVEYQSPGIAYPDGCSVAYDKGQKWELVRRHLDPETIKEFDYVFVWDDDIGIANFDVLRFVKIMESNRLAMAQPSLVSPHPICHDITRQQQCPPALGSLNRVGRLTNFVEIMVPVFTRESWAEFYSYLTPAARLGWGFDSLLLGRKGIVDCMHVVHTRPCSQYGSGATIEMREFLNSQALFECSHQNLGHLLEEPIAAS
ncbi:DUF707 domain-containing protein [Luteolibacter luteus]|uniref:DUF707 domain-containing protein n=1 Tax=Luteolibacter luteus TaxID=2728835 RepID=A0A858REU1_9BACT|nr:DUF707 domain-containing protein [Luteolibacter luteus]QJE95262.1 DUF707 domain-containing protein [Luteolibacter luteus]